MEFLLKYATFWGCFFMFSWAKNYFLNYFLHFSVRIEKLHKMAFIKKIISFLKKFEKVEKIGYHS